MKKIMYNDYNPSLGILIDVQHPIDYKENPTPNSKNIYAKIYNFSIKEYKCQYKKNNITVLRAFHKTVIL